MDKFDFIILFALSDDCRQSLTKIGKQINRSPQFVKYRVDQLKRHVIKQIPILVDFYRQGFQEVTALIKFPIIDPLTEKTFIDFLFKRKETYKLFSITGEHSILCSFIIKNQSEIHEIKESLLEIAPFDVDFSTNYKTTIYSHNYLGEHCSDKKITLQQTHQFEEMPSLLKKILVELQQNPFSSNLEISQKLKESYDRVSYSIKNNQLILGNNLLLSNQITKKAFVFLKVMDFNRLSSYCDLQKNVLEISHITGAYDVIVALETISNLKQTIGQLLFDLRQIIQKHTVCEVNNTYKYGWYR